MTSSARPQPAPPPELASARRAGVGRDDRDPDDLERMWRLVISRRGRLERLLRMRAPGIVVRNERRMLRAALGAMLEIGPTAGPANDTAGVPPERFDHAAAARRRRIAFANPQEPKRPRRPDGPLLETGE